MLFFSNVKPSGQEQHWTEGPREDFVPGCDEDVVRWMRLEVILMMLTDVGV